MKKNILIIGWDSLAEYISRMFEKENILLVSDNKKVLDDEKNNGDITIILSRYNHTDEILNLVKPNTSAAFICLPELLNESILLITGLKEKGIADVYAEVNSEKRYDILSKIGDVKIIYPAKETAAGIIESLKK